MRAYVCASSTAPISGGVGSGGTDSMTLLVLPSTPDEHDAKVPDVEASDLPELSEGMVDIEDNGDALTDVPLAVAPVTIAFRAVTARGAARLQRPKLAPVSSWPRIHSVLRAPGTRRRPEAPSRTITSRSTSSIRGGEGFAPFGSRLRRRPPPDWHRRQHDMSFARRQHDRGGAGKHDRLVACRRREGRGPKPQECGRGCSRALNECTTRHRQFVMLR